MPVTSEQTGVAVRAALAAGIPVSVRAAGIAIADVTTGEITHGVHFTN